MSSSKKNLTLKSFPAETILQGMPELAYVFDKEGRMLMWNKNIEKILGYSDKELLHKPVSEFQDITDRERVFKIFKEVFDQNYH